MGSHKGGVHTWKLQQNTARSGKPLNVGDDFEAGWPDAFLAVEAAANANGDYVATLLSSGEWQ